MRATAEPEEGNKIRLSIQVDENEIDKALDDVVRTLGRQVRVPGFRPGKVPRRVLEARMGGATALRAEALNEALPDFYAQALSDTETEPIANPDIDITSGEESGPVEFDAVVEVRPSVVVPGYAGLQVTVPSPEVTDVDLDGRIDAMRETEAELEPADRPIMDGDVVTIDIHGTRDGEEVAGADDYLHEIGATGMPEQLDPELLGAKVGEIRAFDADSPEGPISFRVLVKQVQVKVLPDATDEWAAESSEFETIDELRADLEDRLGRVKVLQAQSALRSETAKAVSELVDLEQVPEVLVESEIQERLGDLGSRMQAQGISIEQFLAATGQEADDLVVSVRADAVDAIRLDLALRGVAEAEALEVSEEELDTEIAETAEQMEMDAGELRHRLDHAGRTAAVRSERKKAKALDWLLEHVEITDEEGNVIERSALEIDRGAAADGLAADVSDTVDGVEEADGADGAESTAEEDGE